MRREPLLHILGRLATRVLLHPLFRSYLFGSWWYLHAYLLGKWLQEGQKRAFFRSRIGPGMSVLDIGANVGFYTIFFAALVGPSGRIYAFEPDPFCFDLLAKRVRAHRYNHVTVEQCALSDHKGHLTLYCSRENRADNRIYPFPLGVSTEAVRVPMTTLDAYLQRKSIGHIDLIKMDIQGAEIAAFRGMREMIKCLAPRWLFLEFAPRYIEWAGDRPEDFWNFLREWHYRPYHLDASAVLHPIVDEVLFTEELHDGYADIFAERITETHG